MIRKSKKIFLFAFIVLIFVSYFVRVPELFSERLVEALWPLGHFFSFFLLAWYLLTHNNYIKDDSRTRQFFILLSITVLVGGGIEILQPFFSRSAQLNDLFYDLFGTLSGYIFFANFQIERNKLITLRFLYFLLFVYFKLPILMLLKDEYQIYADFPIIIQFKTETELTRCKSDLPLSLVNDDELLKIKRRHSGLMKITFADHKASRAVLRFFASDWQGYQQLKLSFYNPNSFALKVRLIITDAMYNKTMSDHNDRYGQWLEVPPGWYEHSVSLQKIQNSLLNRKMDLSSLAGIDFYMYDLEETTELYLDKIELLMSDKGK